MKSVSICHAPADRDRATELARFIDANFGFDVSMETVGLTPDDDLVTVSERALSANFAVVLFSPASVPAPLKRERWERVFVKGPCQYGNRLAFVLLADCPLPQVLRRMHFFDGSADFLTCKRDVKRWMMAEHRAPVADDAIPADTPADRGKLEDLWREIVDRPGFAHAVDAKLAAALAWESRADFERVLRIRCAGRPLVVIAGELGRALGLKLTGPVDEDLRAVAWQAIAHRYLFLLEGANPNLHEALRFPGRCSIVMTNSAPEPRADTAHITAANIADAILRALALLKSGEDAGGLFSIRVTRFLRDHGFTAEEALMLDVIRERVPSRAHWAEQGLAWIRDRWGESVAIPFVPVLSMEQLDLFGDSGCLQA